MKYIVLCLAIAGCSTTVQKPEISPLVIAQCSDLVPPTDDSFGATTYALIEAVGRFKRLQAAACPVK
jgi:hypothetical protein